MVLGASNWGQKSVRNSSLTWTPLGAVLGRLGASPGGVGGPSWAPKRSQKRLMRVSAGKAVSKAILEPFGGRLGGRVGCKNEDSVWEGCKKSAFPPYVFGARLGAPPRAILGLFWDPIWGQNRSQEGSGTGLENEIRNRSPQTRKWKPRTRQGHPPRPPKPGPRRPEEGPEGGAKRDKCPTSLPDPLGTPFWAHFGPLWGAIWGPFWG